MAFNSTPGNAIPAEVGSRPPTSLDIIRQANTGGAVYWTQLPIVIGCKITSAVSSTTITEVVDIVGSGVLTFAGLISSNAGVTAAKLSIEIDGVTVAEDLSLAALQDSYIDGVVGSVYFSSLTQAACASEGLVPFNKSLKVSIAGDGTNDVYFVYKRYLT